MNILDQFTIVQRNRIEAVWNARGRKDKDAMESARDWATALVPNIVEISGLCWATWFGGPAIVASAIMTWIWAVEGLMFAISIAHLALTGKVRSLSYAAQDSIHLDKGEIYLAYSPETRLQTLVCRVLGAITLVIIGLSGRLVQAGILIVMTLVSVLITDSRRDGVKEYVYHLDHEEE